MKKYFVRPVGAAILAAVIASPAAAEYPDRQIDMIITYGAGGGFDVYARAVSQMMAKSLPKGVNIIPRNVPGAGGRRGTALLYRAPADGYTLGILNLPGMVEPEIVGDKVHFEMDKFIWLGGVNIGTYSIAVGPKSKFASFEAMQRARTETYFATAGGSDYTLARIMADVLKLKAKFVTGYKGAPAAHLATVRGEADATMAANTTIASKVAAGDLKPLLIFQDNSTKPEFAGVKTVSDIGHSDLANLRLYRLFAAPPGLSHDVRAKLTAMVEKAVNDPDLEAWGKKAKQPINPISAADAERFYKGQKGLLSKFAHLLKK
jgi:tripartite-type tricarboxylate transporter receptor subunit TctC